MIHSVSLKKPIRLAEQIFPRTMKEEEENDKERVPDGTSHNEHWRMY